MANLYPPYIEGKIPAQYGNELKIPFQHNRTADITQPKMTALIKTVFNGDQIAVLEGEFVEEDVASFTLTSNNLFTIGQYYKIQLAYGSAEEQNKYYSTAGVFKYTKKPKLTLEMSGRSLTGTYSNDDKSEKEYSYRFDIYEDGKLYHTSGEIIHQETKPDTYTLTIGMAILKHYDIQYIVQTINGIVISTNFSYYDDPMTPHYFDYGTSQLVLYNNEEDGSIQVQLFPNLTGLTGTFRLLRYWNNNYYEEIGTFGLNVNEPTLIYEDTSVEHGKEYLYALQAFNGDKNANKLYSNKLMCNFEHMFLSDATRQLCVKFDPKVSSFKTTLQESKVDTMGSQYPFFFRNGMVKYKEFPISGLISTYCDENNLFLEGARDLGTNLTHENFISEREFKLKVLDWLNNGEPKIFRSPAEGNYIVRLMNISLSPKDQLGRMLHSFNAQAYEVDEYDKGKRALYRTVRDLGYQEITLPQTDTTSLEFKEKDYLEIFALEENATVKISYGSKIQEIEISPMVSFIPPLPKKVTKLECTSGSIKILYSPFDNNFNSTVVKEGAKGEYFEQYSGCIVIDSEWRKKENPIQPPIDGKFNITYAKFVAKPSWESGDRQVVIKATSAFGEKEQVFTVSTSSVSVSDENRPLIWGVEYHNDNFVIQSKNFVDGIFKPEYLKVGDGVYAYIYYTKVV